jgi:hypothetical protein
MRKLGKILIIIFAVLGGLMLVSMIGIYLIYKSTNEKVDNYTCRQYLELIETDSNWNGNELTDGMGIVMLMPTIVQYEMSGANAPLKWQRFVDILTDTCRLRPDAKFNSMIETPSLLIVNNDSIDNASIRLAGFISTMYPANASGTLVTSTVPVTPVNPTKKQ